MVFSNESQNLIQRVLEPRLTAVVPARCRLIIPALAVDSTSMNLGTFDWHIGIILKPTGRLQAKQHQPPSPAKLSHRHLDPASLSASSMLNLGRDKPFSALLAC